MAKYLTVEYKMSKNILDLDDRDDAIDAAVGKTAISGGYDLLNKKRDLTFSFRSNRERDLAVAKIKSQKLPVKIILD